MSAPSSLSNIHMNFDMRCGTSTPCRYLISECISYPTPAMACQIVRIGDDMEAAAVVSKMRAVLPGYRRRIYTY